jgi:hypothetical protein
MYPGLDNNSNNSNPYIQQQSNQTKKGGMSKE